MSCQALPRETCRISAQVTATIDHKRTRPGLKPRCYETRGALWTTKVVRLDRGNILTTFLLAGLTLFLLGGLVVVNVYSPELVPEYAWMEPLFWTLATVGILKIGLNIVLCSILPCMRPGLSRFLGCSRSGKAPCAGRQ